MAETQTTSTRDLKQDVKDGLAALKTLRDEIRVNLHLAGMDARDEWKKIEPRFGEVENLAKKATEASRAAVTELVKTLQEFRKNLTDRKA